MKYVLVVFDGMADIPDSFPGGRTPILQARADNLREMAAAGVVGIARTTPDRMTPGSDVTNMGILGYDPAIYYKGRGAIEAAALGIEMSSTDAAYRTNLVTVKDGIMIDSSADHISDGEARELIDALNEAFACPDYRFYPGVSYRHIMILRHGSMNVQFYPPYKFVGEPISTHMPQGDYAELFGRLITESPGILEHHPVNLRRKAAGKLPANMIWFWAEGMKASFDPFEVKYGKKGAVIAGVDLIKGLGRLTGLTVPRVAGATGYIDTSYENKAAEAVRALKDHDFVWVHVEAPDEAGHERNTEEKIKAIEAIDGVIVRRIRDYLAAAGEDYRMLLMPDHPTPVSTGSHNDTPVPFVMYDSRRNTGNTIEYSEAGALQSPIRLDNASQLMDILLERKSF
ncbi:MAG: cofactor-independent phosphoglycerate mutase [Abditibacteriota bacterium]|nr:cofactor-independent phosphoglycerate mutase [Abditibacteriota bacterium]